MNRQRWVPGIAAAAVVVWLVGLGWSVKTFRSAGAEAERLRERAEAVVTMQRFAQESARYQAARERVQATSPESAVGLAAVVTANLPGARVDDARRRETPLGDGWVLHDQDIVLDDAGVAGAMALVDALEARQPPWRLSAMELRASPHTAGAAQVALTVSTLQPER